MKNKPTDNNHKFGGSRPVDFGCHIPIFFSKIAHPFTHSCNTYAKLIDFDGQCHRVCALIHMLLAGKVNEFIMR